MDDVRAIHCLFFLMGLLFCTGTPITGSDDDGSHRLSSSVHQTEKYMVNKFEKKSHRRNELESSSTMPRMDVITPITTVPVINPTTPTTGNPTFNPLPTPSSPATPMTTPVTNPYTTPTNPYTTPTNPYTTPTNPYTTPTMGSPASPGQSWCVASQTASQTALQVALDYACGFGGADCSAIQSGGSCYNPDTLRDHASYAFNNYYQKNPVPTSCDFGGTAVVTSTDPSTSTCQYPSTSTGSSVLNTTNPTGSTVFGSVPPATSGTAAMSIAVPLFFTLTHLIRSLI